MSQKSILIDSNILVYAINSSSPKNIKAQDFLQKHIGHMVVAHQNIFETLRVLTHKKFIHPMTTAHALAAIASITKHCHVIAPSYDAQQLALLFIEKHALTGNKIFDAYLTATSLTAGVTTLATDNIKDFSSFEGITIVNPFI